MKVYGPFPREKKQSIFCTHAKVRAYGSECRISAGSAFEKDLTEEDSIIFIVCLKVVVCNCSLDVLCFGAMSMDDC